MEQKNGFTWVQWSKLLGTIIASIVGAFTVQSCC